MQEVSSAAEHTHTSKTEDCVHNTVRAWCDDAYNHVPKTTRCIPNLLKTGPLTELFGEL